MPSLKLRFGEVEAEESIPQMEAVAEAIERAGIFGQEGSLRGVSMESDATQYVVGEDYIFLRFAKQVEREQQDFNEEGEVVPTSNSLARIMHFMLTRSGDYAFESVDGVHEEDALEYLIGEDGFEYQFTANTYTRFTWEQMRQFYEDAFRVRGLKLSDVAMDEDGLDRIGEDLRQKVEEAADDVVRMEVSTGQEDNNLQSPGIIDAFAQASDVKKVRIKDHEGNIQTVNQSGRYEFSYSSDLNLEEKGERVRSILETVNRDFEFGGTP
jgi:hypothetical protein